MKTVSKTTLTALLVLATFTACGKKGEILADDRIVKVGLNAPAEIKEPEPKRDFVLDALL